MSFPLLTSTLNEPIISFPVHPGMAEWDEPHDKVHRGVNVGSVTYEEVVVFFLDDPEMDPQPEPSEGDNV